MPVAILKLWNWNRVSKLEPEPSSEIGRFSANPAPYTKEKFINLNITNKGNIFRNYDSRKHGPVSLLSI